MVFFLTGVPGSGKTYYLVNYAEQNIEKVDKKTNEKQYLQIVHNISGYKRGFYVDFGIDYLPKIISLNEYYLEIKKDLNKDDLLIKKAEELGIYKILLIIDECHLYFVNDFSEKGKKQYYALLWFISYHRHLYVDMVLATQNLSLVDYKFKAFAEFYVKAIPSSMRFNLNPFASPKFTYYYFPDSKMWNDTKFKTEKLTAEKRIFDLYTSGDAVKKQKVYLQTLLLIGGSLIVVGALAILFQYTFTRNVPKKDKSTPVASSNTVPVKSSQKSPSRVPGPKHNEVIDYVNEEIQFDVVTCSTLSGNCSSELTNNKIHYFLFTKLIKLKLLEAIKKESQYGIQTFYLILHLSRDAYISKFLIKPNNTVEDEKYRSKEFDFGIDDIKKHMKG
jgi:zona occludens toxin